MNGLQVPPNLCPVLGDPSGDGGCSSCPTCRLGMVAAVARAWVTSSGVGLSGPSGSLAKGSSFPSGIQTREPMVDAGRCLKTLREEVGKGGGRSVENWCSLRMKRDW